MAPPEWMKRFEEIGQKGEEEVTAIENDGFVKTLKPSKRIDLDNTDAPVNRSSTGSFIGDKKERKDESSSIIRDTSESDVDDDAAAAYGRGGLVNNFQSKDETNKSCGDASGIEPEESSTVADEKVEENDNGGGDDDDLEEKGRRSPSGFYARLLSSPPKDDGDEQVGSDNITSMAITVDNDDDDQQQHQQPIDFGERWVVDHNEFSNNETENGNNCDSNSCHSHHGRHQQGCGGDLNLIVIIDWLEGRSRRVGRSLRRNDVLRRICSIDCFV